MIIRTCFCVSIFTFLVLMSASAFGNCAPTYCKGSVNDVLEFVYVHENGNIYMKVVDPQKDLLNCTLSEGVYMTLDAANSRQREIYATLLTAISTKRTITLRITENTSNCRVSYIMMNI